MQTSSEKTLYIGGQNPTKSSFYVMQDDDDHVYLADANTAGYLSMSPKRRCVTAISWTTRVLTFSS